LHQGNSGNTTGVGEIEMTGKSWNLLLDRVKKILWEAWDPIGVNDCPAAATEYDSYAPKIVSLLIGDCSASELEHHLAKIETTSMGLPARPVAARATAVTDLIALKDHPHKGADPH
jgi:hypothetical protein